MATITFEVVVSEEQSDILRAFLISNNFQFLEKSAVPSCLREGSIQEEEEEITVDPSLRDKNDNKAYIYNDNTTNNSMELGQSVNGEVDTICTHVKLNSEEHTCRPHIVETHYMDLKDMSQFSPRDIVNQVDHWLRSTGVSQKLFANKILSRQQSTLSELIKRAPEKWPDGRGRWVYERMFKFLFDREEHETLFALRKELSQNEERSPVSPNHGKRGRADEMNYLPSFALPSDGDLSTHCNSDVDADFASISVTPREVAQNLLEWLKTHRVSQSIFAKKVLDRQQSTLSGLITNASDSWPKGNGKIPYLRMYDFLNNSDLQQAFLAENQKQGEDTGDETKHSAQKAVMCSVGKGNRVKRIRRSMFGNFQKAALDQMFMTCNGKANSEVVEKMANSLDLEQHQIKIWFQNHRRLQRAGVYRPGQYQQYSNELPSCLREGSIQEEEGEITVDPSLEDKNDNKAYIYDDHSTTNSTELGQSVNGEVDTMCTHVKLNSEEHTCRPHIVEAHYMDLKDMSQFSPRDIVNQVDHWLRSTGVSQKLFANKILSRQQSTLSELIKRAPEKWPDGRGRWVYERMFKFLFDREEHEALFALNKEQQQSNESSPVSPNSESSGRAEKMNYLPSFALLPDGDLSTHCNSDVDADFASISVTPREVAQNLLEWLKTHRVSQSIFAKKVLDRQQSTLSGLITNASDSWPKGNGKIPYLRMYDFLNKSDLQQAFLAENEKQVEEPGDETKNSVQRVVMCTVGKGNRIKQIRRSMFGNFQKAALDRMFMTCNGKANNELVEQMANSLDLEQHQIKIWFQNHRRLQKSGVYKPGQYQQYSSECELVESSFQMQ